MIEAWRSGRATYDEAVARECLEGVAGEDCERWPGALTEAPAPGCLDIVVGTVDDGGACMLGHIGGWSPECAPGLVCVTEGACPGRCESPGGAGDECSQVRPCASGEDLACVDGTCVDLGRPDLGEACVAGDLPCQWPSTCLFGTCVEPPTLGELCDPAGLCEAPLRCEPDDAGEHRCEPWLGSDEGEVCRELHVTCTYPLVCAPTETPAHTGGPRACTRAADLGEACGELQPCGPYGRCVDGRCREIVDTRRQCDEDHVCPATHACVAGVCQPLGVAGDPCASRDDCFGSNCEGGLCTGHDPAAGEPCHSRPWECAPGLHCADTGAALICREACST